MPIMPPPRPVVTQYNVGTGIAEVTDPAIGLHLQGMADDSQIATGVESPLYARAFVVEQRDNKRRVAIVIADIWSGTRLIKSQLLNRLARVFPGVYTNDNVLLAGTHTHSAPGGYSGTLMYDYTAGGLDQTVANCIVTGCAAAVTMATANLAPGRIYVNRGSVADCGRNRSLPAYLQNPQDERDHWGADTDTEMLLLRFVKIDLDTGAPYPVGALNWYAIHPTDRGQKNTLVCGDNKGYASALFEQQMGSSHGQRFVAAFANANCGDVSGNVELGHIPDGDHDKDQMQKHGRQQFDVASALFQAAREEVTGPVVYRHTNVDFSNVLIDGGKGGRTYAAALGVSFAAGSSEDSVPVPALPGNLAIREGLTDQQISFTDSGYVAAFRTALVDLGLSLAFGLQLIVPESLWKAHAPKPIIYAPGLLSPPGVPQVLPVQLIRIGTLAVPDIPGELTTMAGRRLRTTVSDAMSAAGVKYVALGTYANDYAQYITTREEYGAQHYEGASTLFGPFTLPAFQEVVKQLATAMVQGTAVAAGPNPGVFSAPPNNPWCFRNLSPSRGGCASTSPGTTSVGPRSRTGQRRSSRGQTSGARSASSPAGLCRRSTRSPSTTTRKITGRCRPSRCSRSRPTARSRSARTPRRSDTERSGASVRGTLRLYSRGPSHTRQQERVDSSAIDGRVASLTHPRATTRRTTARPGFPDVLIELERSK